MLNVKSTKTLQCSEYILQIPLYYVKDIRFRAASAVLAHMHTYPAPASSFLFMKSWCRTAASVIQGGAGFH